MANLDYEESIPDIRESEEPTINHEDRNSSKNFKCDFCDKHFSNKFNLNRHKTESHEKLRDFKCPHCMKHFTNRSTLTYHIRTHTQILQCHLCEKIFKTHGTLNDHLKTHDVNVLKRDAVMDNESIKPKHHKLTEYFIQRTIDALCFLKENADYIK